MTGSYFASISGVMSVMQIFGEENGEMKNVYL
jgi:hypothetical protein